jgi:hypothetical protein
LLLARGQIFGSGVARPRASFRLSFKDQRSGETLKIELIDAPGLWGERRYRVRVNGRMSTKTADLTLTEIINRLRPWLVARAKRSWRLRLTQPDS